MAVFRKDSPVPAVYSAPRALTAAAAQVKIGDKTESDQFKARRASSVTQWQQEAWEYYDAIGEIKYAFNLVGSVVSRIRLYAAVNENPAETPISVKESDKISPELSAAAERALQRLDSAYGGQAGLLRDAALNLSVTGECYLVQMPARIGTGYPESWDIRSVDELSMDGKGNYQIRPRHDSTTAHNIPLPSSSFIGRIWRAHPRFSDEPDSSLKGLLDLCAELLLLNRTFRGTARSRLNAGALYLPDGLSVASSTDPDYPYDENGDPTGVVAEEEEDQFEEQLIDAMTTPISDEASASAVVPLIIRGPAELGDKIKQFKFERSFDPALAERSDRVLERILQGLDVPKDVVTGLANVKYSNALQIDESLYKAHIEPLLLLISDALTVVYLRPYLRSLGYDEADVNRLVVWYDPSAISTRNDRAADADSGFDKMAVSYAAWRHAHGFSEADAPDATETAIRMLIQKGSISPELTEALLGTIAPDIMGKARQTSQEQSVAPLPPNVEQALGMGAPESPTTPEAPATPEATPAEQTPPAEVPQATASIEEPAPKVPAKTAKKAAMPGENTKDSQVS